MKIILAVLMAVPFAASAAVVGGSFRSAPEAPRAGAPAGPAAPGSCSGAVERDGWLLSGYCFRSQAAAQTALGRHLQQLRDEGAHVLGFGYGRGPSGTWRYMINMEP